MTATIADQPLPVPNDRAAIVDLVIADLVERKAVGIQRYGTPLQPFNGRLALVDAYQEVLDLAAYLRQEIEERKAHQPRRGSDVEAFVKAYREQFRDADGAPTGPWYAVDGLLDLYRDHADTGTPLGETVTGPHPEED